ncbi:MAG: hypothetical protein J2P48_17575 [Alphaproteobacteria bacterium]|nr:hypothetical protein [Alphaproteobacteria bacterium]
MEFLRLNINDEDTPVLVGIANIVRILPLGANGEGTIVETTNGTFTVVNKFDDVEGALERNIRDPEPVTFHEHYQDLKEARDAYRRDNLKLATVETPRDGEGRSNGAEYLVHDGVVLPPKGSQALALLLVQASAKLPTDRTREEAAAYAWEKAEFQKKREAEMNE